MIEYLPHMACLFGGAVIGFGVRAALTAGKLADTARDAGKIRDISEENEIVSYAAESWAAKACESSAAHARVTDALAAKNARITTLADIACTRFDDYGPWNLISATKEGVTARRPRAGTRWFTWRQWWEMPAHHENSLQAVVNPNAKGGAA